jgi:predicted TIM-barrel fold metal-dependent hydrolase
MIIDAHAHLDLEEIGPEDYIRMKQEAGVRRIVLLASLNGRIPPTSEWKLGIFRFLLLSPFRPLGKRIYESLVRTGNVEGGGQVIRIVHDPDNEAVARVLSRYPDHFLGFVVVNPRLGNSMEIFERWIEEPGMVGVKCHSWWHRFDPSTDLLPIAKRCEEKGLPLLIHLGAGPGTGNVQGLLNACPRLKLILAHAGIPFFRSLWPRVKTGKNCFVDISGSYLNASIVKKVVAALGPDKVLFGSDGPVSLRRKGGGHGYESILRWTYDLPLPDADKEKILSGNLEKLLP